MRSGIAPPSGRGKACTTGSLIYGRVALVDVDALVAVKSEQWSRLEELAGKRHLSGGEADELIGLYQSTAADLSTLRSLAPEPALIDRLSNTLNRARGRSTGGRELTLAAVSRFFLLSLPAAFYRVRWWTLAVMVVFCLLAVGYGMWVYHTPGGLDTLASPAQRANYSSEERR